MLKISRRSELEANSGDPQLPQKPRRAMLPLTAVVS